MVDIRAAIPRDGLRTVEAAPDIDALVRWPTFAEALRREAEPWVAEDARALASQVPIALKSLTFRTRSFFRPELHKRAFYYAPSPNYGTQDSEDEPTDGVIAFKGTEPLLDDFEQAVRDLCQRHTNPAVTSTQRREGEHFAWLELKAPLTVTMQEAREECERAAELQLRHLEHYGTLAALPRPLWVHRLPGQVEARILALLRAVLSRRSFDRLAPRLADGFAIYTYAYPSLPIRASHLDAMIAKRAFSFADRQDALEAQIDPDEVVGAWATLFVRLIHLGWLPAALGNRGVGNICDMNNAVVDGGFVDVDSVIPIRELDDDRLFFDTLHFSYLSLCNTARRLLAYMALRPEPDVADHFIQRFVDGKLRAAFEREARPGLPVDPRVGEFFAAATDYAGLLARLRDFYPKY